MTKNDNGWVMNYSITRKVDVKVVYDYYTLGTEQREVKFDLSISSLLVTPDNSIVMSVQFKHGDSIASVSTYNFEFDPLSNLSLFQQAEAALKIAVPEITE